MKRCIAKKAFVLTHDAPDDEAFIRFANAVSLEYLDEMMDSLDLGDSMGVFINLAEMAYHSGEFGGMDDQIWVSPEGFTVTINTDWELFQWDDGKGELPNTLGNLIIEHGLTKERIEEIFRRETGD